MTATQLQMYLPVPHSGENLCPYFVQQIAEIACRPRITMRLQSKLQAKCREHRRPVYIAFVILTKAFDLFSRKEFCTFLEKIGCSPKLLSMITSFHEDMHGTLQHDAPKEFPIHNGVKPGCVLAPTLTLFGLLLSLLLSYAFGSSLEGVCLHLRTGKLFNLARLRAKTKVRQVPIRRAFR